ncbi:MAG: carotenoid oxygenase family protein [Kofleriaceae bacterium]
MITSDASPAPTATVPPSRAAAPIGAGPSRDELAVRLFTRSITREHGFEPLEVEGALPRELRGTLVRNGPGQFGQFGQRYAHSFEGDGLITAIRLDGGAAHGACRLTAGAGLTAERAAGKVLYGTALPWRRRFANALAGRSKNTANTHVVPWQGRLLALMEAARPTELALDAHDVTTIGETDLGGVVGAAMSAHPHRVAARAASYNFGVEYGRHNRIVAYELPDVGPARRVGEVGVGFSPMLHDFIATAHHLVWFLSPVAVHVPRMLLQLGDFNQLFRWQPERGTEVIVMPIDRPAEVRRFTVDAFYQWHFANAHERDGLIELDYVRYPDFASFGNLATGTDAGGLSDGRLHRATLDVAAGTLRSTQLLDDAVEFPRVHPGRDGEAHGHTWLVGARLDSVLGRAETGTVTRHQFAAHEAVSEAVFVPRPGASAEDDGWLVTLLYDGRADRSGLAVLDARDLPAGPVARAWFDHAVPITFHGSWLPAQ